MKISRIADKTARTVFSLALASTMVVAVSPANAFAADDENYVLRITDLATLQAFQEDVASGKTYEGVTVTLAKNLDVSTLAWTPIGSKENPFCGTFNGNGHYISGLAINAEDSASSYVGFFGYVGVGGVVENFELEGCTITVASSTGVMKNIGSIAGYVYGAIGSNAYALLNCKSDAEVSVTSTMVVDEAKIVKCQAPDAVIEAGYTDEGRVMEYIGGLTGYCAGSIDGCTYTGDLMVRTDQLPDPNSNSMATSIGGVVGQVGGYVICHELDNDMMSYEPVYPTADGSGTYNGNTCSVANCSNEGSVTTVINADAGKDRFDRDVTAKLQAVGGIAGYAMTSFANCSNSGRIEAPTGDGTGGICGVLRGITFTGTTSAASDPGMYKPDGADESARLSGPELKMSQCINSGTVYALHAGGGICGGSGTYTSFNQCVNEKSGDTHGCRWNKPMIGGIVGQTYGSTSYCYNRATVSTDEALKSGGKYALKENGNRIFQTGKGAGYYCAGIVGACYRFVEDEETEATSPAPEIYACYTTGDVLACDSYNQAGICGESEGTIHNCYFLADSVSFTGYSVANNLGSINFATVIGLEDESEDVSAADLLKSKAYTAKLNAAASVDDFSAGNCFVPAPDSNTNDGYSIFTWQRSASSVVIDESKLVANGTGTASYSATMNPLPALDITYDGTALVCGADFYPVPDSSALNEDGTCKDVLSVAGQTFTAHIVGMGDYSSSGITSWSAPYALVKGDFSTCTVQITAVTYNFYPQYPATPTDDANSQVVIYDASGKRISAKDFTMASDPGDLVNYHKTPAGESYDKVLHDGYQIAFTANADSNYEGTAYGFFIIRKAALINSDKARITGVSWNGKTWQYSMSGVYGGGQSDSHLYTLDSEGNEIPGMSIPYTGESIKPTIDAFMYKDRDGVEHELVLDEDYRVVYGDPGSSDELIARDVSDPNVNVSSSEVGNRACFTFRFVADYDYSNKKKCNFNNYEYVFFNIVPADLGDASQATVTVPSSINVANGTPAVTVKGATGKTLDASNYTVSVEPVTTSTARITVKGVNNCTGAYSKVVKASGIKSLKKAKIKLGFSSTAYNGKAKKPSVKATYGGKALKAGTDYVVSYSSNTKVGVAKVKIKGTGTYAGTVTKTFVIRPAKVAVSKAVGASKKLTVKWVRAAGGVTGYQVRYAAKSNMAKAKTIRVKGAKSASKVVKKLVGAKRYYVQVRAYKKVGSKTYAGAWSKKKSVTVKK